MTACRLPVCPVYYGMQLCSAVVQGNEILINFHTDKKHSQAHSIITPARQPQFSSPIYNKYLIWIYPTQIYNNHSNRLFHKFPAVHSPAVPRNVLLWVHDVQPNFNVTNMVPQIVQCTIDILCLSCSTTDLEMQTSPYYHFLGTTVNNSKNFIANQFAMVFISVCFHIFVRLVVAFINELCH